MAATLTSLIDTGLADRLLGEALARGGDFAEVYGERATSTRIPLEEDKIQSAQTRQSLGVGIRVIHGERRAVQIGRAEQANHPISQILPL